MSSLGSAEEEVTSALPFDAAQLDGLLEEAGLDALVATSPHNVRYLLGGYEFFMYALADSIGLGRFLVHGTGLVTRPEGPEPVADHGRGWNRIGG